MRRAIVILVGTPLLAGAAWANPYANEVLRVRRVPGPHVQLTYGKTSSFYPMKDTPVPTQATSHGTGKTAWTIETISFRTNTGSGVVIVPSLQMCDCNVPTDAELSYAITVPNVQAEGQFKTLGATTAGRPAPSSTMPDGGLYPWDIPDPTEVQGLDCGVACASLPPSIPDADPVPADAPPSPPTVDASAPRTEDPPPKVATGGGACAFAPAGKPVAVVSLFLLAVLAGVRRRRG